MCSSPHEATVMKAQGTWGMTAWISSLYPQSQSTLHLLFRPYPEVLTNHVRLNYLLQHITKDRCSHISIFPKYLSSCRNIIQQQLGSANQIGAVRNEPHKSNPMAAVQNGACISGPGTGGNPMGAVCLAPCSKQFKPSLGPGPSLI